MTGGAGPRSGAAGGVRTADAWIWAQPTTSEAAATAARAKRQTDLSEICGTDISCIQ